MISRLDQTPAILLNESPPRSWIRLELIGRRSNRSAIGVAVEVHAGGRVFHRQVKGGGSYLSANDPRVLIGLGDVERVDSVEVRWPSGARSMLGAPSPRRTHVLHEPDVPGVRSSPERAHDANTAGGTGGLPAGAPDARHPEGRRP